ncbi:MAG: ATP-binding cassette domain-containing protein, partial [Chitinophagaceae bacterium]|nr:ATP-binding cassette domain-containing protein [Anaerolineae bacterium]
KTTITRLLFRLYEISGGALKLNGIPIHQIPIAELQHHVGMVTQDVQLFRATVRDNLTFFDLSISDQRIMQVIEELELMGWYNTLSNGLDTELESGGKGLSAGEGQLLAFTRVFLKNPGLVILDEASSRLDPATEQRIERAVDKLLKNRTGIIVAHRLKTVERADQIIILEEGGIGEYGLYADLANDPNSRFAQLLRTGIEEVLA